LEKGNTTTKTVGVSEMANWVTPQLLNRMLDEAKLRSDVKEMFRFELLRLVKKQQKGVTERDVGAGCVDGNK